MSVKSRVEALLQEITQVALQKGRDPAKITVVAVSKYATGKQIEEAYAAGLRHFGESRLQTALIKREEACLPNDIVWHFIGPIQSNKAALIAEYFSCVHSVSSLKIAKIISEISLKKGKVTSCFLQINIYGDPSKQGFTEEEFWRCKEELDSLEGIHIEGLMTMAPHVKEEEKIRDCFQKLHSIQTEYPHFSMGMSEDFKVAIEEGSTHIRIGSYLFPG